MNTIFGNLEENNSSTYSIGIGMIAQERWEQINKHGWDEKNDADYGNGELLQAALFAINPELFSWPNGWHKKFKNKILAKDKIERLRVAGAFVAAEIDRIKSVQF